MYSKIRIKQLKTGLMAATLLAVSCLQMYADVDSLLKDKWRHTTVDNITFVSNASQRKSKSIAIDVHQFLNTIGEVLPYPTRKDSWPLRIYICKDQETFVGLAPKGAKYQTNVSGIFTEGLGYDVILLLAESSKGRLQRVLYHELIHRELRPHGEIPLWLNEGLAEVYSHFKIRKKKLHYGLSADHHRKWIQRNGVTPLRRLFHVHHQSPDYNHTDLSNSFYATAWLFCHYCLFEEKGSLNKTFLQFIEETSESGVNEAIFKQYFGTNFDLFESKLIKYARSFLFPNGEVNYSFDSDNASSIQDFNWSKTQSSQTGIFLAGAATLSKRFQIAEKCLTTTDRSTAPENGIDLLIEQATLSFHKHDFEASYQFAESAYLAGDRSPTTLLLYSQKLLKIVVGQRIDYKTVIPLQEVNRAFDCINQVLESSPRHPLACRLYVLAWLRTNAEPSAAQYRKLMQNAHSLGDDAELAFFTADLFAYHRKFSKAKTVLHYFVDHTSSVEYRQKAQKQIRLMP